MKDLKSFLTALENNVDFFDINILEYDMMDIPYQIKKIDENIKILSDKNVRRYFNILDVLKEKALKATPKNELQKEVINDILEAVDKELHRKAA